MGLCLGHGFLCGPLPLFLGTWGPPGYGRHRDPDHGTGLLPRTWGLLLVPFSFLGCLTKALVQLPCLSPTDVAPGHLGSWAASGTAAGRPPVWGLHGNSCQVGGQH